MTNLEQALEKKKSYNRCTNCTNCISCTNCNSCNSCTNCISCSNQFNKKFMAYNIQLTEDEYHIVLNA